MRFGSVLRLRPLGLHPATWLVGMLAAALLLFIALPGEQIDSSEPSESAWWGEQTHQISQSLARQFPHVIDEANQTVTPSSTEMYEHGWPQRCAVRGCGEMLAQETYSPGYGYYGAWGPARRNQDVRYWTQSANWPLRNHAWRIHYGNLAINLAAFVLVVAAAMWAAER